MNKFAANQLDGAEIEVNDTVKELCAALDDYINTRIADSREKSIALTKLEECAMWATKAVAFNGVKDTIETIGYCDNGALQSAT